MYFTHKYFSDNNNDLFKPLIYTTDTNYNYNLYSDYQLINNGPNNALERPRPLRGFTECLTACGLSGTRPSGDTVKGSHPGFTDHSLQGFR